jgi:hypothetical protein
MLFMPPLATHGSGVWADDLWLSAQSHTTLNQCYFKIFYFLEEAVCDSFVG